MSKLSQVAKDVKNVIHSNVIKSTIKAGGATTGPPLGPILGQRGLPLTKFVEEFNDLTKNIKPGIPLPTRIHIDGKKFSIEIFEPEQSYLIRQAAGIKKGSRSLKGPNQGVVGKITHKHVYEIAKIKIQQENIKIRDISMKEMCEKITEQCYKMGVDVVRHLDADEYDEFLLEREEEEKEYLRLKEEAILAARKKLAKRMAK